MNVDRIHCHVVVMLLLHFCYVVVAVLYLKVMCSRLHTLMCLAASGLNKGVLQYCRNNVAILFLRPKE